jgi:hypothetical protein
MKTLLTLLLCLFALIAKETLGQIVINEGSNKNYSTLSDEDGDFEDWIELHNTGASAIDVFNYTLSDDSLVPNKWILPHLIIPAGGYAVIFCSGKDRYATTPFTTVVNTGAFVPVVGWNNHPFSTPFMWDGVSNIVINVCSYAIGYTSNSSHNQSTTSFNSSLFSVVDGSESACSDILGNTVQQRPNLMLNGAIIGNGTVTNSLTDYPSPYGNWYWAARHQLLVRSSELSAAGLTAGNINSLAFDIAATNGETYSYVEYSLSAVSDTTLSSTYFPLSGFQNHTNFKLSAGGEKVYLYSPTQIPLSRLDVDAGDLIDVSVGSFPNGSATIKKFQPPTPDASNNSATAFDSLALAPTFSVTSGVYDTPFAVSMIDSNVSAGQIRYTTDGSEPDLNSLIYVGTPIFIYQSTVLRAKVYKSGYLPSVTTSATYFFNVDHVTPIISVITDNDNLYGPTGMFDNFYEDWLKAAHVEYFDSTDAHTLLFSQRAGIIMDGGLGGSRSNPQRSFRVKLGDGVLGEGAIDYPIIPNRPLRTKYSDFYLRNGSNQYLTLPYKEAAQVRMMMEGANGYYSAWRPVTVYINGQYFGLYELREKYNLEMFNTLENAHQDSTEILSLSAFYNYTLRALEGNVQNFYDDYDAFNQLDPVDTSYWENADPYFDLTYYTDYIIGETWMGNTDWPGNNIKIYRSNASNQRWRFCMIDPELALLPNSWSDCTFDAIDYIQNQSVDLPYINVWLQSIQNERFKNYFINRYADLMNTNYLPSRLLAIDSTMFNLTVSEMANEYYRWGDPNNVPAQVDGFYQNHMVFQSELLCRSDEVRDHIEDNFNLPKQVDVSLDVYPFESGEINISTITPEIYPWSGVYFDGIPVKLEALGKPNFQFSHWEANPLIADTLNPIFLDTLTTDSIDFTAHFVYVPPPDTTAAIIDAFLVYPNPTSGNLTIVLGLSMGEKMQSIRLYDIMGREHAVDYTKIDPNQYNMDVSHLSGGYYVIKYIALDGSTFLAEFIKQ